MHVTLCIEYGSIRKRTRPHRRTLHGRQPGRAGQQLPERCLRLDGRRARHHRGHRLLRCQLAATGGNDRNQPRGLLDAHHRPARHRVRAVGPSRQAGARHRIAAVHRLLGADRRDPVVHPARLHRGVNRQHVLRRCRHVLRPRRLRDSNSSGSSSSLPRCACTVL